MTQPFLPFLRLRAYALGFALVVAIVTRFSDFAPPPRTLDGLATLLGRTIHGTVQPGEIAWAESPGFLQETFYGRSLFFLGATESGRPRDLYRAWVRVSLDGKPISVSRVVNLTNTPLGDESGVDVVGNRAVIATTAFNRIQGITVFKIDGIPPADEPRGLFDRLLLAISSLRSTGTPWGLGRMDVFFDLPPRTMAMHLEPTRLRIDLGDAARNATLDLEKQTLRGADGGEAYAARVAPQVHSGKPFIHWAVDTVRDYVGPDPVAWIENSVFGVQDTVKRAMYGVFSKEKTRSQSEFAQRARALAAKSWSRTDPIWPPRPIPSLWEQPLPGEGEWEPIAYPWLAELPHGHEKPPPYFYKTFTRPDPERPYSRVLLIAMDMRQLEIRMEAGYEDPAPLVGPPGAGRLPNDHKVLDRVVATFNGGFKTTHGQYGMMVDRRVIVPAELGAATVVVTQDGDVGLGNWPQNKQLPSDVQSFRQNLDPLLEDGVVNPTGRYIWGWHIAGQGVLTERTALCITPERQIYYAWAREISGPGLAAALKQAGCDYAIHLDMNPKHCGFVFTKIIELEGDGRTSEGSEHPFKGHAILAHPDMGLNPTRYIAYSQKDFFYVLVRDVLPASVQNETWRQVDAVQPPPAWLPATFESTVKVGDLEVRLLMFDKNRFDWAVRAGGSEPSILGRPPKKSSLSTEQATRALAAINLGYTTDATRYGLAFDGQPSLDLRQAYATLVLSEGIAPKIVAPGEKAELAPTEEAVQLPLLADKGERIDAARDQGAMRLRGGLCITPSGRVLVAMARHDSNDPIASALLKGGCARAVALDRGSRHPSFVHFAGSPTPPLDRYETSVLYALGRPMIPRAFRWRPEGAVKATKPTGFDVQPH